MRSYTVRNRDRVCAHDKCNSYKEIRNRGIKDCLFESETSKESRRCLWNADQS